MLSSSTANKRMPYKTSLARERDSPAKAAQIMTSHRKALLLRHVPHWPAHPLVRHPDKARCDFFHCVRLGTLPIRVNLGSELLEFGARSDDVEGLVCVWAEDGGELGWDETAKDEVGIGNGERSALAVAGRAGTD